MKSGRILQRDRRGGCLSFQNHAAAGKIRCPGPTGKVAWNDRMSASLNPIGLSLAGTMSLMNVLTDVARKHALEKREINTVTFWTRIAVTAVFGLALGWHILSGSPVAIRGGGGRI